MFTLPKDIYEKLEFDKVLELLENECLGELGRDFFRNLTPQTDLSTVERQLKEVKELKIAFDKNDRFTLNAYEDFSEDLRMLAIEGYVLSLESVVKLYQTTAAVQNIYRFFTPVRQQIYPTSFEHLRKVTFNEHILKEILRVMDDKGNIKSDASPELVRIRRLTQSKIRELETVYRRIIGEFRQKGLLTDGGETVRNGRRVLSVPVEHKRSVRGIIHDESATGKTAFIEPEGAIDVNNEIFELEAAERGEIYRILRDLSAVLRPHCVAFAEYQQLVVIFDVLQSKARLAQKMKANMPQLSADARFGIHKGKHPLLYIKNRAAGRETVPFNLELRNDKRVLLVSGPNAGGKSVLLKAIGLMQLMLQSGLLVPVHEFSNMGIFDKILVSIGDAQSIEDDLSTYSSHLTLMNNFLQQANEKTLFLIDEFGGGTDPKMGGAIAEGVLRQLNFKKTWGVVTTHYGNLKMFAYKSQEIINGCMNFDKDTMTPTYTLTVGRPGSSYAFEIATKVGLNPKVVEYAKKRVGEDNVNVDELLIDLQREKQELEQQLAAVGEKQQMLSKLIKTYDEQLKDVEFRRKKLKLDSKEMLLAQTAKENKEIEKMLRALRAEKDLEKARGLSHQIKAEQVKLGVEIKELSEEIYYQPSEIVQKNIEVGDFVKMKTGSATGKVETISKQDVVVIMGEMRMKLKLRDLQQAAEPLELRSRKSVETDFIQKTANFETQLDIRGLDMMTALKVLQDFLDNALMTSSSTVRIVHGKGDGVLRKVVKEKLREYKSIKRSYQPESFEGGDGVTIVEF